MKNLIKNRRKNIPLLKFSLKMKITTFLLVVTFCNISASNYAQNTKISLELEDVTMRKVLSEIESKTDFKFLFNRKDVDLKSIVSVKANKESVKSILDNMFLDTAISFEVLDKQIVLKTALSDKSSIEEKAVIVEEPQTHVVSGIVTDGDGEPLPGASILEKGTTNGTESDFDGNFSLNVTDANATLVVSFIGYLSQEISVAGQEKITIALVEDAANLDEVVVVGYGTVKRKDVTGAIGSVKSKDFIDALPMAPEQILQGKVAGVSIVQSSGEPGAASSVRIRGSSSVSAGNDPLYVIDGVPLQFSSPNGSVSYGSSTSSSNPLNIINPSDIESIDVLKDASATAIYGSRGANGVIIITTKNKGRTGDVVTYDGYVGVSSIPEYLPFMSADEFRKFGNDNNVEYPDEGANTDWQDEIYKTALSQNHNLSFAGGSATANYRASFGYSKEDGIINDGGLTKYNGRINAIHKALDGKLNMTTTLAYSVIENDRKSASKALAYAFRWAPTLPVRNQDGSYYQLGEQRVNPVSYNDIEDLTKTNMFLGNISLSYNILESLKFNVDLGYSNEARNQFGSIPDSHPAASTQGGLAAISKFQNGTVVTESYFSFNKQITANSYLTALLGYSFQRFETESTFTEANQFVSTAVQWNLMQSGSILSNTSYKEANRLSSYYARVNYKLMDRYIFTATVRRDGSSRFGGNNKWGTFPSAAIAWNIADESFMTETKVSNLKLRIGYGVTGNQELPNYLYLEQLGISGTSIYYLNGQAIPAVIPTNFANPDLQWEETAQANIGVDFGFFNDRFSGSIDLYNKTTDNLLLSFSTAAPSVVGSQWANVGEVTNKGIEVSLNAGVVDGSDFTWDTNINFAKNKNNVVSLSNETFTREDIRYGNGDIHVSNNFRINIIKPGLPLGTFYGRQFTGYDANGLETYLDVDGIEGADELVIGQIDPDFTFGFNNSFTYKRFDASINFSGAAGNDIYNNTRAEFSYPSSAPGTNVLRSVLTSEASRQQNSEYSSQWIEDGSYLRLDNLSIGYNFNVKSVDFIKNARLYLSGKNLFVLTNYTGYDPEVNTTGRGVDYLAYPRPRTFITGVSISF